MKSYSAAVLTLIYLVGAGLSARAQDAGKVVVKVPFEFVAGGETLPAGTYSVTRVSPETHPGLLIHSYENSAFVLPVVVDGAAVEHVQFSFEHVGDKYFLSKVETPLGVYTVGTPRAMTKLAQMKGHHGMSSSGSN